MGLINTEEASLQHAERSQKKCCPQLSFIIKKTTEDNFGQLIELNYITMVLHGSIRYFHECCSIFDAIVSICKNCVEPCKTEAMLGWETLVAHHSHSMVPVGFGVRS